MNEQEEQIYQLYGRKSYEEPLAYVHTVTELPREDEPGWVELVAVPETAVIRVIPWHGMLGEEKDE